MAGVERLELDEAPAERRRREHAANSCASGVARHKRGPGRPGWIRRSLYRLGMRSCLSLANFARASGERTLVAAAQGPRPAMSKRAWLQFSGIAVIWGLPYFFIRIAVRDLDPGTLVFFRTGLASLILLPFVVHRREVARVGQTLARRPRLYAHRDHRALVPACHGGTEAVELAGGTAGRDRAHLRVADRLGTRSRTTWGRGGYPGLILGFAGVVILAGVGVKGSSLLSMGEIVVCAQSATRSRR